MAITVIEPASLNFAENPIVFKATTSKKLQEGESFLRIRCNVTFQVANNYSGITDNQFMTELSQPVEESGTAVFNMSDSVKTLTQRIMSGFDMNGSPFGNVSIIGYTSYQEVWLFENQEVLGDSASSGRFYVVPGGLTDYEMMSLDNIDLASMITSGPYRGRLATRKPDGGIVYRGEEIVMPYLSVASESDMLSFIVDRTQQNYSTSTSSSDSLCYALMVASSTVGDGEFNISTSLFPGYSGHYRSNPEGVQFLRFINGFGAIESISVRSKDKLSYEVSGENHSLVQEISTRPTDRRYATKSQPSGVYELSSGYVPKRWAEWYVQELIPSPRAWILIDGVWVPALIEAKDECVIYDRSKPEMPHVDFTLRLAIDGVTGCTW